MFTPVGSRWLDSLLDLLKHESRCFDHPDSEGATTPTTFLPDGKAISSVTSMIHKSYHFNLAEMPPFKGFRLPGEANDFSPSDFSQFPIKRSVHAHLAYCFHPTHKHEFGFNPKVEKTPADTYVHRTLHDNYVMGARVPEILSELLTSNQAILSTCVAEITKAMPDLMRQATDQAIRQRQKRPVDLDQDEEMDAGNPTVTPASPTPNPDESGMPDESTDEEFIRAPNSASHFDQSQFAQEEPAPMVDEEDSKDEPEEPEFIRRAHEHATSGPSQPTKPKCSNRDCSENAGMFICGPTVWNGLCEKHATDRHARSHYTKSCALQPVAQVDSNCIRCHRTTGVVPICDTHQMCPHCLVDDLATAIKKKPDSGSEPALAPYDCPGCSKHPTHPQGHLEPFAKRLMATLSAFSGPVIEDAIRLLTTITADPLTLHCDTCLTLIWGGSCLCKKNSGSAPDTQPFALLRRCQIPSFASEHTLGISQSSSAFVNYFPNVHCGTCFAPMEQRLCNHSADCSSGYGAKDFCQHARFEIQRHQKPCPGGKRVVILVEEGEAGIIDRVTPDGTTATIFKSSPLYQQLVKQTTPKKITLCTPEDDPEFTAECGVCFEALALRVLRRREEGSRIQPRANCRCKFCQFPASDLHTLLGLPGSTTTLEDAIAGPPRLQPVTPIEHVTALRTLRNHALEAIKTMQTHSAQLVARAKPGSLVRSGGLSCLLTHSLLSD